MGFGPWAIILWYWAMGRGGILWYWNCVGGPFAKDYQNDPRILLPFRIRPVQATRLAIATKGSKAP